MDFEVNEIISSLKNAALEYARAGIPIFPCHVGGKQPLTSHGFKDAITDPDHIRGWWDRWPQANIGMPTGAVSGVWVLDGDLYKDGSSEALQQLVRVHGALPTTRAQTTGGGGTQWFFSYNGQKIPSRNGALGPGLDVKGDGGYVILPPSVHPSGGIYVWDDVDSPVAAAPQWLIELVKQPKQQDHPAPDHRGGTSTAYGLRAVRTETNRVRHSPEGERNENLNAAAYALGQLIAGGELSQGLAEESLRDAALVAGLDPTETDRTLRSGLTSGIQEPRTTPSNQKNTRQDAEDTATVPPPPSFPLYAMPDYYRAPVEQAAKAYAVPTEIPAVTLLFLVGALVGRSIGIVAKSGWVEHPNLYVALLAHSGLGKSPLIRAFMRSIFRTEKQRFDDYQKALELYEEEMAARKRTKKEDLGPPPEKPKWTQIYVEDATEEALTDALSNNPKGVLWYADELAGLLLNLGRYRSDGKADGPKARLMSAYDCGPWKRTRKSGDNAYISHACLSILGTLQPAVLPRLFDDMDAASGFLPRFIVVKAEQSTPPYWTDDTFDGEMRDRIDRLVESLVDLQIHDDTPTYIGISNEAKAIYKEWYNEQVVEPWIDFDAQQYEALSAKLRAQCLRVAIILHVLECSAINIDYTSHPVQTGTMQRAIAIANWIKANQRYVWQALAQPEKITYSSPIEKRIAAAIVELESEIKDGNLPTAKITEKINEGVDPKYQATAQTVGRAVKQLGLYTKKSTGGMRVVHITADRLDILKKTATTATTATNQDMTKHPDRWHFQKNATTATPSGESQGGGSGGKNEVPPHLDTQESSNSGGGGDSGDPTKTTNQPQRAKI